MDLSIRFQATTPSLIKSLDTLIVALCFNISKLLRTRLTALKMEYGFVSSPSGSPSMSNYSSTSQYHDSTSEASSPRSPRIDMNNMVFNNPMSYEMYSNPSSFYTMNQGRIPVEYTGSSTLDERDRRRRRTGSTTSSKDTKEALPNMHLVRIPIMIPWEGVY